MTGSSTPSTPAWRTRRCARRLVAAGSGVVGPVLVGALRRIGLEGLYRDAAGGTGA